MALYGFRTLSNALLVYTFVAFRLKCAYIIYSFILSNQRVTFAISCGRSDIGAIRCAIVTYFGRRHRCDNRTLSLHTLLRLSQRLNTDPQT